MERHFEGEQHAKLYKRYRPCTPQIAIDIIMEYVRKHNPGPLKMVVDVGCGNGQHTMAFAPHFEKVLGTDISPSMVSQVANDDSLPSNVSFLVSPAEKLPLPDASVDLVTGAQCFHWFDHEPFNKEMERVLKPNGVVAMIGHDPEYLADPNDEKKSDELANLTVKFLLTGMTYLRPAIRYFNNHYTTIPFPYDDVVHKANVTQDVPITLADYLGVLETFSHFRRFERDFPEQFVVAKEKLVKDFKRTLGAEEETSPDAIPTTMRLDTFMVLGRKKST